MLKTLFLYLIVSAAGLKLQAGFKVEEDPEKTPDGKLPPIAPVTFGDTSGCKDVYDHSHSVSAPFSNCNPPAEQSAKGKAAAEADKAAKKKAEAEGKAAQKKVDGEAAKPAAEAAAAEAPAA